MASCATLGLDYSVVGRGEFIDAVAGYNRQQQPDKPEVSREFASFMRGEFARDKERGAVH